MLTRDPLHTLLFTKPQGSNALDVANGIYSTMDKLNKSFPSDVAYKVPFESVSVVKVSIDEVVKTLLEALALVVLVIFIFLQDWAFNHNPGACHSCVYNWNFHFLHSTWFYY